MENANSSAYLQSIVETIERQLSLLAAAPSVQMHDVPDGFLKNREKPGLGIIFFLSLSLSLSLSTYIIYLDI